MDHIQYLLNAPGGIVAKETALCFMQQLIKDLKSEQPKIRWYRDLDAEWGTFFTNGLSGDSYIQLKCHRNQKESMVCMSYAKDGKLVYNLLEFNGSPSVPTHLSHLYKWVKASVRHQELYGDTMHKGNKSQLSVEEMDDYCLKIIDVFRSLTAEQIEGKLMKGTQYSVLNEDISEGSPEWIRRCKMIRSLVKFVQLARIKESALILENTTLKDSDGKSCGNIATEPVAKWVNAYIIVQKGQYAELSSDEIRLKVASDIVANLLIDM